MMLDGSARRLGVLCMSPKTLGPLLASLYQLCELPQGDGRTDADLLERFSRTRDQAAFAALVYRHGAMVLAVCQRLLADAHEAEDAFQATFLVLVRKSSSLRQPGRLASWLHGVAQRIALRLRQKSSHRQALPEGWDPADERAGEPLDGLRTREVRAILDEEIERLPSKYRLPVVLCYLQGQSYTEAARSLGWPAGTVSVRLARARQKLRDRFVRRGLGAPATLLAGLLGHEALAAPVPARLFASTIEAAAGCSAGGSAAALSPTVIALAEGALQAMWMSKVKSILVAVAAVGLLGAGLGGLVWQRGAVAQDRGQPGDSPRLKRARVEEDQPRDLEKLQAELQALEAQLKLKQRQIEQLRQDGPLNEIEAALKKLRQANAGDPKRRAAVEEFAKAFALLKQDLAGKGTPRPRAATNRKPIQSKVEWLSASSLKSGLLVDGRVLQVDTEKKQVLLSGGSKDGFKKGQLFRVYQSGKSSPDQTGWVRITEVAAKWSVGSILQDYGPRAPIKANDVLQIHDGKPPKGLEEKKEE
jgi:RNA polymerase sigma factor (sigma-70 family)